MKIALEQPVIIQGGMGIGISNWQLAKTVSQLGALGVISGTALNLVFVERLRKGDPGGHIQRALIHFPFPDIAQEIFATYFVESQSSVHKPFKAIPMYQLPLTPHLIYLTVVANFCEVFLAKENHHGKIGINYLEKVQLPNLPSLYGAMLADVDYVFMGAGIPREIPAVLDKLANHEAVSLNLQGEGFSSGEHQVIFNPQQFFGNKLSPLKRPQFIAIVSSDTLAITLAKKSVGQVNGFVIEHHVAGGHNASPRGVLKLNQKGEPIYGDKDIANFDKVKSLGIPFWLAGGYGNPGQLAHALHMGAQGIQVGTAFAFCQESGLAPQLRKSILEKVMHKRITVFTDPLASPTGFPFKIVSLEDSLSESSIYQERPRICQLGYLRQPYQQADGTLGYRCPGEPEMDYVRKGGKYKDTIGRKCLCNSLMANIGFPQQQKSGYIEKTLVTAGEDLSQLTPLLKQDQLNYSVKDVINYLLG